MPYCGSVKPIEPVVNDHTWCRYFISNKGKFWNPLIEVGLMGVWYVGYECSECGEQGYVV